jgi:hypothetical protein
LENLEKLIDNIDKRPRIVVNYIFWYDDANKDDGIDILQSIEIGEGENRKAWALTGTLYTKSGKPVRVKEMTKTPVNDMMVKMRLETQVGNRTMSVDLGAREVLAHRANLDKDVGEMALGERYVYSQKRYEKCKSILKYRVPQG